MFVTPWVVAKSRNSLLRCEVRVPASLGDAVSWATDRLCRAAVQQNDYGWERSCAGMAAPEWVCVGNEFNAALPFRARGSVCNEKLYELLALFDALRAGMEREREVARRLLEEAFA
jgi:hypothetical protein